jgi:serine/threonine protein kinase
VATTPPFAEGDAVALAHAQIARRARPPHEINSQVPLTLSRIVLKLLEKEPEERYQSASALADDLREAKKQWLRSTTIEPFPLASHEVPRGLGIPDKLYGRDEELQSLADAFARTRAGGRQLVLVTGGLELGSQPLWATCAQLSAMATDTTPRANSISFSEVSRSRA